MNKILGLDLGTNSIGWAVIERDTTWRDGTKTEDLSLPADTDQEKYKGVLIFPEGVKEDQQGNKKSKAAERTDFRSARRLKFRRKLRKYETLKVLIENGLCPLEKEELEQWRVSYDPETGKKQSFKKYPSSKDFLDWLNTSESNEKTPYYFRDKFSRQKYDWHNNKSLAYELGRAFYHLAQRRGFASNRADGGEEDPVENLRTDLYEVINEQEGTESVNDFKARINVKLDNHEENDNTVVKGIIRSATKILKEKSYTAEDIAQEIKTELQKEKHLSPVKKGIKDLTDEIQEAKCDTLGQFFYKLYQGDRHDIDNKIRKRYTDREEHYKKEFEQICNVQDIPPELREQLIKAIFYQRPLKSQKGLVGKCTFETDKPRCPVSHPDYEEYRMWSFINTIKIKQSEDNELRPLNEEEINTIVPKFYRKKKHFSFNEIADILLPKEQYTYHKDPEAKNYTCLVNYKPRTTVSGCPVTAELMSIFGRSWEDKQDWKANLYNSWKNKQHKNGTEKSKDEVVNDFWHALFQGDFLGNKEDIIGKSREEKLEDFAKNKTNLTEEQIQHFTKIKGIQKDYAELSLKAIRKILPWLKKGLLYSHAVFMANMDKVVDPDLWYDNQTRNDIETGIQELISQQNIETQTVHIINSKLAELKNNGGLSEESIPVYEKELKKQLEKNYSNQKWLESDKKATIIENAWQRFRKQANKNNGEGEYLKPQRIDEAITNFLLGHNNTDKVYCSNRNRLKKLYHPSDIEKFQPGLLHENGQVIQQNGNPLKALGNPEIPSIKNPVVMRTLYQLRKLVNVLLKENIIDDRTKIHIELARELNDGNKRAAIERYQRERESQREAYRKKIQELYERATGETIQANEDDISKFGYWIEQDPENLPPFIISEKDVEKYQYWDEQYHCCIYTGKNIGITDFIGPNPEFDIEHTIPRSASYDNSQENKTLCESRFNREVKQDRKPTDLDDYEAILRRIEPWKQKYEELEKQIEYFVKRTREAQTKEQKDTLIQQRHYLTFHKDYWKGKYERFLKEEINDSFKNSQKTDTGTITKYAREYLGSVFKNQNGHPNVFAVNGSMVDQFRKAWGLHEKEVDEEGNILLDTHDQPVYKAKDRNNHVHHCIDAITVACMTREKYDQMAHAWGLEDKQEFQDARKKIENSKPWDTFTEDIKQIEDEVLVVHHYKDNVPKQSKKKKKQRGSIQHKAIYKTDNQGNFIRNNKGEKTVQEWIYLTDQDGNKIPEKGKKLSSSDIKDKKEGKDYFHTLNKSTGEITYYAYVYDRNNQIVYKKTPIYEQGDTARGSLHKESFYGAIKRPEIDETSGKPRHTESGAFILKKNKDGEEEIQYVIRRKLEEIKKTELKEIVDDEVREKVNQAIEEETLIITSNDRQLNKLNGNIWMNKAKGIPIKKVRVKAKSGNGYLKNPLGLKKHRDVSRHNHKQEYYVANDDNYAIAIYEGIKKRDFAIINLKHASTYFALSNKELKAEHPIIEQNKNNLPLKAILKHGTKVFFYKEIPEEIWDLNKEEQINRLYYITKFDNRPRITVRHHQVAKAAKEINESNTVDFNNMAEQISCGLGSFNVLIENIDFKITPIGQIIRI